MGKTTFTWKVMGFGSTKTSLLTVFSKVKWQPILRNKNTFTLANPTEEKDKNKQKNNEAILSSSAESQFSCIHSFKQNFHWPIYDPPEVFERPGFLAPKLQFCDSVNSRVSWVRLTAYVMENRSSWQRLSEYLPAVPQRTGVMDHKIWKPSAETTEEVSWSVRLPHCYSTDRSQLTWSARPNTVGLLEVNKSKHCQRMKCHILQKHNWNAHTKLKYSQKDELL